MLAMVEPLIVTVRGRRPRVDPEAWVAPNATLIGQVRLAARASVWYSATLRTEAEPIDIGVGTNIRDGVTVGSLVAGVPGRVRRELSDAELAHNRENAAVYEHLVGLHRDPE